MSELKLCRICLNKDLKLFKIGQCNLKQYYEEITQNQVLAKDDLPQYFCFECSALLHKFHKFKEKCEYGRCTLKNLTTKGYMTYHVINDIRKHRTDLGRSLDYINQLGQKRIKTVTVTYKTEKEPLEMENITLNSLDTDDDDVLKFEFIPDSDHDEFSSNIKSEDEQSQNDSKTDSVFTDLDTKPFAIPSPTVKSTLENPESVPPTVLNPEITDNNIILTKTETSSTNIIENDPKNNIHTNSLYESDDNRLNDVNFDLYVEAKPKQTNKDLRSTKKSKRPTRKSTRSNKDLFQPQNDYSNSSDANFKFDLDITHEKTDNKDVKSKKGRRTPRKTSKTKLRTHIKEKDSDHKFVGIIRQPKDELSSGNWETKLLTDEEAMDQFKKKEFDSRYERMEFKCTKCFKGFSKNEMLLRHNKLWHDHGDNQCRFCHMQFKWKSKLQLHMRKHYYIYKCLRCGLEFFVKTGAVFHDEHHNGVTHTCRHCGEEYTHISTYYTHLRTSHRNAHACTLCGETFVSSAGVVVHMKRKHVMHVGNTEASTNIYCQKCKISFVSQSAYDTHLAVSELHEEENKDIKQPKRKRREIIANAHRCQHCDKKFNSGRQVRAHIQQEHPGQRKVERVVCEICGAVLSCSKMFKGVAAKLLREHMDRDHPGQRRVERVVCSICGEMVSTTYIHIHMNRHTRSKIFRCETCGKEFLCANSLNVHKMSHSGERPHACPICPKRFSLKAQMEVHYKRVHLKEPYPKSVQKPKYTDCPVCHKTFQSRSHMDTHLRRVHLKEPYPKSGPKICPICSKPFAYPSDMDLHYRRVHLKEPYPKRTYNRKNRNRQPPNEMEVPLYASLPK